jgi:hypothetical protein
MRSGAVEAEEDEAGLSGVNGGGGDRLERHRQRWRGDQRNREWQSREQWGLR